MKTQRRRPTKPSHVSRGNVLYDLGFSAEESAAIDLKVQLHREIMKVVKAQRLAPRRLQELLGVPQPRVSELLNGKIFERMSSDRLAMYLRRLGRTVEIRTRPENPRPTEAA
jgi:predicted XRE-type DNA-binding protein